MFSIVNAFNILNDWEFRTGYDVLIFNGVNKYYNTYDSTKINILYSFCEGFTWKRKMLANLKYELIGDSNLTYQ